jgi:23S rRNA pseudouridine2605 synthase
MTEKQRRPLTLKRDSDATPEASRLEERLHKVLAQAGLGSPTAWSRSMARSRRSA